MIRCPACITSTPYIPKDGSLLHHASRFNIAEPVQVSVVMPPPARPKDANDVTAEIVFAYFEDDPVRGAKYGATQRRKDVDSFVTPVSAARSAPRIFKIL